MTACARSSAHPPGAWNGGFALVTVLWLAMLGFLGTTLLLGMMGSQRRALQRVRESLLDRLALEEAVSRVAAQPAFLPRSWDTPRDSLLTVGDPPRSIRVVVRRWGLWAIAEFHRLAGAGVEAAAPLLARRILFGNRSAMPGVVAYLRTNPYPLVLADQARVEGIVALRDSIQTEPWLGFRYAHTRPPIRRGVDPFTTVDVWQGLPGQIRGWIRDPASAPDGIKIHPAGFGIRPGADTEGHLIVVDGDLRLRGRWDDRLYTFYVTGDLEVLPGTVFRGQLLVEGRVQARQAQFTWPTLLAVQGQDDPSTIGIELREGTVFSGCLALVPVDVSRAHLLDREVPSFFLDETSELLGAAYIRGGIRLNGLLQGWMEADETLERIESGTYHNWLVRGIWRPLTPAGRAIPFPLPLGIAGVETVVIEGI